MDLTGKVKLSRLAVVVVTALAAAVGPANAFQASYNITGYSEPYTPYYFSLPKYSGPGTVADVIVSMVGTAGGVDYFPYNIEDGITVPSAPVSWDVLLQGPGNSYPLALDARISTQFVGGTIPPCTEPDCMGLAYAYFGPLTTAFSATSPLSDVSDFQGAGSNDFLLYDASGFDSNYISVTISETITLAGTPEPSTWAMMLVGLGVVGASLRRRIGRTSAAI